MIRYGSKRAVNPDLGFAPRNGEALELRAEGVQVGEEGEPEVEV